MNVHCIILAYALPVQPVVDAIMPAGGVTCHIFLHSARPDVAQSCRAAQAQYTGVRLYDYQTNRGNSRSCNDGIVTALRDGADAILLLNDDLSITRADFDRLAQGCAEHPEAGLIYCNGYNVSASLYHDLGFCCFGINRTAIDTVGYLDQLFVGTYFDDSDYRRRCALFGVRTHSIGDTNIVHQGSATIRAVPELQTMYPVNEAYYVKKHGGTPGQETFLYPFGDSSRSWFIGEDERHG